MLLVTTAMKPLSDFTTPRRLIAPISRHFFPVEQPEPPPCCTTGLKNGSRFPFIAHFFSCGLGAGEAAAFLPASAPGLFLSAADTLGSCAATFGAAILVVAALEAAAFSATTGLAAADCGLAAAGGLTAAA